MSNVVDTRTMVSFSGSLKEIKTPKKIGSVFIELPSQFYEESGALHTEINVDCTGKTLYRLILVSYISLSKTFSNLKVGESLNLIAKVDPSNATGLNMTWKSSDDSVACVDENGKVTAKANGTATITVTAKDIGKNERTATCLVGVESIKVNKINLNQSSMSVFVGESEQLVATVLPENATDKSIGWASDNQAVAIVDSSGNVRGKGAGTANITASSADGSGISAVCSVKVIPFEGWMEESGKMYWYEKGIRQGTYDDPQGVLGDGTVRGREIYDPKSDGWYWLDSVYDGAKACRKEVWIPYIYQNEAGFDDAEIDANAANSGDMAAQVAKAIRERSGKWVRYDANGKMYKGWYTVEGEDAKVYPDQAGNTYYYDPKTGLMAKGNVTIDGRTYHFDEVSGVLDK